MNKYKNYDVAKFLSKSRLDFKALASGKEAILNCLWHNDTKRHLSINLSTGLFQCWRCREKGNFVTFSRKVASTRRAGTLLLEDFESTHPVSTLSTKGEDSIAWPEGYVPLFYEAERKSRQGKIAYKYLQDRGIKDYQIEIYKLGFCCEGKYEGRIVVPVLNYDKEIVSFIARDYTGVRKPKVLTPMSVGGSHGVKDHVFNLYEARKTSHLIITEGVFDAINTGTRGVCLFGKTATQKQLGKIIATKPLRISVMLDPDAQKEANTLGLQLINYVEDTRLCTVPEGYDPGSATAQMIEEALIKYKRPSVHIDLSFIGNV